MEKIRRRHILFYVIIISLVTLFIVFQSYDKYSRNKSINDNNRPIIEKHLTEDEKKFLIDNNTNVELFLPFITMDNFVLENYEYYDLIASNFTDLSKQEVVNNGNFVVEEEFTLRSLERIFNDEMYDIDQLIRLVEDNVNSGLKIEFYPKDWNALSNFEYTIGDFKPNDLVRINSDYTSKKLYLREEANDQLNMMCDKLRILNDKKCGGLKIEYAYISYDALNNNPKRYPSFIKPSQNDFQLGNTISFKNSSRFDDNNLYLWLKNNSYNYGFVLRYPNAKSDLTKVENQFGVFRYVGVENALKMVEEDKVIEEMR